MCTGPRQGQDEAYDDEKFKEIHFETITRIDPKHNEKKPFPLSFSGVKALLYPSAILGCSIIFSLEFRLNGVL